MDLATFRVTYPGLYQAATDKGAAAETKRCADHLTLAIAAGCPDEALRAIDDGSSVADASPRYQRAAGRSDETSAAYLKALTKLGVATATQTAAVAAGQMRGGPQATGKLDRDAFNEKVADLVLERMGRKVSK